MKTGCWCFQKALGVEVCTSSGPYLGRVGEHELGTERLEEDAALEGHGRGHGQGEVVALSRGDERQADARSVGVHQTQNSENQVQLESTVESTVILFTIKV